MMANYTVPRLSLSLSPSRLALQNLVQDKLRLVLSATGVALVVMLILFLLGLRAGMFRSAVIYLDNAPGSIVVAPAGVRNSSAGSGQLVPPETAAAVASTAGVAAVTPVLLMYAIPELHGKKEVIRLTGYEAALGGGPWKLIDGREPVTDDEVVLDKVLADRHGFRLGDSVEMGGRDLKIVGLSGETSSWTGTYVFARKSLVESLVLAPQGSSFLLITPAQRTNAETLMATLRELPNTNVLSKTQMMANDQRLIAGIADQVVLLMVAAAFIVGTLVVGMVIYTATTERGREYGILKAIGARSGVLYRVVASQAVIAAGLGALLGVGFAFGLGALVMAVKPQFLVVIEIPAIGATLGAGFVMALGGALLPARAVARLAPAEVFRR